MEQDRVSREAVMAAVLYILFIVGAVGFRLSASAQLMSHMTPYMLWVCGLLVAWQTGVFRAGPLRVWFVSVAVVTFIIEIIGAQTGLVFGSYTYGPYLGWQIGSVPAVIGLNWVLVILGCASLCRGLHPIPVLFVPAVALCTVVFDILLEPVAIRQGWWQWQAVNVPLQNYVAWFVISLLCAVWLGRLKVRGLSSLPGHYLAAQVVFLFLRHVLR